jgi:hypothetical protein
MVWNLELKTNLNTNRYSPHLQSVARNIDLAPRFCEKFASPSKRSSRTSSALPTKLAGSGVPSLLPHWHHRPLPLLPCQQRLLFFLAGGGAPFPFFLASSGAPIPFFLERIRQDRGAPLPPMPPSFVRAACALPLPPSSAEPSHATPLPSVCRRDAPPLPASVHRWDAPPLCLPLPAGCAAPLLPPSTAWRAALHGLSHVWESPSPTSHLHGRRDELGSVDGRTVEKRYMTKISFHPSAHLRN